nr:4-(cytidine 5'-diphospho)-2-C-methyl-D-erythritol kinase [Boudabousia tangfeifanii]
MLSTAKVTAVETTEDAASGSAVPGRWALASAPGKVNLLLRCQAPDTVGEYHQLFTVFQALSLRESVLVRVRDDQEITLSQLAENQAGDALELDPELVDLAPEKHLAYRAVHAFQAAANLPFGADILVVKRVPVAGGMAGGSADAAAALIAANEAFQAGWNLDELEVLATTLGADVPFCLHGENALGTNRGDELQSLPAGEKRWWVMVTNQQGLSTPAVFRAADELHWQAQAQGRPELELPTSLPNELPKQLCHDLLESQNGDPQDWKRFGSALQNDLMIPALSLREDVHQLLQFAWGLPVPLHAFISGSGPTIAIAVPDEAAAKIVQAEMSQQPGVAQALILTGPEPGGRVDAQGQGTLSQDLTQIYPVEK